MLILHQTVIYLVLFTCIVHQLHWWSIAISKFIIKKAGVKVLSHRHLDAHRMRIRSGLVAFTWMRIDLMPDAHRMRIRSSPTPEVCWMRIQTGSHYYSWFTQGYAYHEIVGSVGFTRWLAYDACLLLLSVLLLHQHLERNRFVCWWPSRVVQHGKIKSTMVPVQIWRTIAAQPAVLAGQVSEQPFSSSW